MLVDAGTGVWSPRRAPKHIYGATSRKAPNGGAQAAESRPRLLAWWISRFENKALSLASCTAVLSAGTLPLLTSIALLAFARVVTRSSLLMPLLMTPVIEGSTNATTTGLTLHSATHFA